MDLLESMIDSAIEKQELPEELKKEMKKEMKTEKQEGKDGDDEPQVWLFSSWSVLELLLKLVFNFFPICGHGSETQKLQ